MKMASSTFSQQVKERITDLNVVFVGMPPAGIVSQRRGKVIAANVRRLAVRFGFEIQMFKIYSYADRLTKAATKV